MITTAAYSFAGGIIAGVLWTVDMVNEWRAMRRRAARRRAGW